MTKRTTSHAKTVHLESDTPSPLDRYGVATSHFEHARDPEVSNMHWEIHEEREAQKAKEAEEAERGSILDREDSLLPTYKDEVDRRMGVNQKTENSVEDDLEDELQNSASGGETSAGSMMVEGAGAKYDMPPPDTLETRQQNAETHAALMAKDDYLSKSYQQALANGPPTEKSGEDVWASESPESQSDWAPEPENSDGHEKDDGWELG